MTMLAFKFLREGGVGPFSGFRWPMPAAGDPGEWVVAEPFRSACAWGVHGCDADHLVYWLARELWLVELGGEVVAASRKLVAPRGRLIRRVEDWNGELASAFADACILRAREPVSAALRSEGEAALGDAIAEAPTVAAIAEVVTAARAGGRAGLSLGYLADALVYSPLDPAAGMFCAAHAALTEEGFHGERAWQSRWLARRLDLDRWQSPRNS
jgi:hypothetical protein